MKKMKKILAFLLAAIMMMAMTTTAFAAGTGTITINDATTGATYKAYKVFDATTQGDGASKSVAYTYEKKEGTDALYNALIGTDSPFDLADTSNPKVYNVSLKDGKTASDVSAFFKANETLLGTETDTKTASGTVVAFSNLDYGYYYIAKDTETPGATVGVTSVAPSQVINDKSTKPGSITPDEDNPGGYKVLADKDGNINMEKANTANYGDTVYFILQAQATNYDEGKKIVKYTAYDILGAGFKDFNVTKVTVDETQLAASAYTFEEADASKPATITIPWVDGDGNHLYANNAIIKIYCQAVVDEDAVIGGTGNNTTNTGWFNWKYDNGTEGPNTPEGPDVPTGPNKETDTVTTKVYAIAINKTDKKGNALAGAEFEIAKGDTKIPVTLVSAGDTTSAAVYKYDATTSNNTVTSPASGKIVIKGLENAEYTVSEISAPDGYNIIDGAITIVSALFESSTTDLTLYKDAEGNLTDTVTGTTQVVTFDVASAAINVINVAGVEMPSTGGIGTTIFYVLGGLLAVSAAILLITKKRMNM